MAFAEKSDSKKGYPKAQPKGPVYPSAPPAQGKIKSNKPVLDNEVMLEYSEKSNVYGPCF